MLAFRKNLKHVLNGWWQVSEYACESLRGWKDKCSVKLFTDI